MQFLAILRDSLRETLDSKLFHVMVGLSLLLSLFVGSVTYRPVSMEQQVRLLTDLLNLQLRNQEQTRGLDLRLDVEDFQRLDDRPEPWLGSYRFTYRLKVPAQADTPPDRDRDAEALAHKLSAAELQRTLRDMLPWVEGLRVEALEAPGPGELRFQVSTQGTRIKTRQQWFHQPALFFGALPLPWLTVVSLDQIMKVIGDDVVGTWGTAFTMLLSTVITAFFIPNMLHKGTIDLLLAKPIHRVTLLLYKFVGGLLFMFLNTVVIMAGIWLGLGVQTGVWTNSFLLCIPIFTFQFAIFYAVSALVGVLTRSAIVSILAVVLTWGVLFLVGWTHWHWVEKGRDQREAPHWTRAACDAVHAVLPRYKDLDWLTSRMIKAELLEPADPGDEEQERAYRRQLQELDKQYGSYHWADSLAVSGAFIAVMLGLACWRFSAKDY